MDLTIGANQFFWPAETVRSFYADMAATPAARVVLGELVCSKRLPFWEQEIPGAIEVLQQAGKQVALTTLALITLKRERKLTADLMEMGLPVEINDLAVLHHVPQGHEIWVGPLVNVYNEGTLDVLARRGATRICLPPELPLASVAALAAAGQDAGVAVEVWGHGRLPLAVSGRCYHARLHDRAKDSCQFVCGDDPDGRDVETLDGQPFLAVNGIQTLSQSTATAAHHVQALQEAGVSALRLSPQSRDFAGVVRGYEALLAGQTDAASLTGMLKTSVPLGRLSDGFLMGPSGTDYSAGR
ncbi:MAG: U32 family peptidase [Paracoccus sp. (in: a-proteobacteria)]|uniref:ubiquinone anaerobic biosynthesis protein UbiV n=1 Tax=Paracoccus sp. TaxID=267 RepID=UPI0026E01BF4|nr:U32 family peptidase [Paracoccus sp. (in: a-proteobacteria)]MDO5620288.1 U32 family peptidase [Paracoccus sp. (in: a-proteobacteria)]